MPVTQIGICNSALLKVGAEPIQSITEDNKRARALNRVYTFVRDEVMAAHPWNFAIKRSTLAPTGTEPEFGYTYEYDVPTDCLRMLEVEDNLIDWVEENSKILCDEVEIEARYIYRHTNETAWSPGFAESFAWRLAREVAYSLTQSTALVEQIDKEYKKSLAEARSVDGATGIMRRLEADEWINSRR